MKARKHPIGLLLVFVLLFGLLLRFVFVVRSVEVYGNVDASSDAVIRAAQIDFGSSVFTIDREEIREGVDAMGVHVLTDIRLRLPNTVVLAVEPRVRAAMLLYGGKIVVLDASAVVVEQVDDVPDRDLIYISGLSPDSVQPGKVLAVGERQLIACQNVLHALQDASAGAYVSELNISDVNDLRLITRAGTTVRLGDAAGMDSKIAWMKAVVQDLERRGEGGGSIDVSGGSRADYRPAGA